jgi:hypothetical protein
MSEIVQGKNRTMRRNAGNQSLSRLRVGIRKLTHDTDPHFAGAQSGVGNLLGPASAVTYPTACISPGSAFRANSS